MSISYPISAGAIVETGEGDKKRKGLVTGWVGEGDERECGVMMRTGPGQPFQQYWIPFGRFCEDFTAVGKLE